VQAAAEIERLLAALRSPIVARLERIARLQGCIQGSLARCSGIPRGLDREDRENAIADEFDDVAARRTHGVRHGFEIDVQRVEQGFRRPAFRLAGEAAKVGQQDRAVNAP
jgi:hypothetical protein